MVDPWDRRHSKKGNVQPPKGVDSTVNRPDLSAHPVWRQREGADGVNVRWLRDRKGKLRAKEFYDENPTCRPAVLAIVSFLVEKGRVPNVQGRMHELKYDFEGIHELKPKRQRLMGFFHEGEFFLTNGAPKRTGKQQHTDYHEALRLKHEFLHDCGK